MQIIFLVIFSLSRLAVYYGLRSRFEHGNARILKAFLVGLRVDIIVSGYLAFSLLLPICAMPDSWFLHPATKALLLTWLGLIYVVLLFGAVAEYFYFEEYGVQSLTILRWNHEPGQGEITGMLWADYPDRARGAGRACRGSAIPRGHMGNIAMGD